MALSREPVRLRQRKTPSGLTSLYLDIYIDGHRSYEYLRLYLIPERTRADKEKNRETLRLAEAVRAKRLVDMRNGQFGFTRQGAVGARFFDYFRAICEKKQQVQKGGTYWSWYSVFRHLRQYERRENITFRDTTREWVRGFRAYLENAVSLKTGERLAERSKREYLGKLNACMNQAVKDGIIDANPVMGVDGFDAPECTRMYLTIDEVRRLSATPCQSPVIKAAFLFSCLTGMRRSDVERLRWGDVYREDGFTRIIFRQKKTKGQEYLDITEEAVELMGERRDDGEFVFRRFPQSHTTNIALRKWVLAAGIGKEITFHCARHTFATMMLGLGTDIYTVSKLLGHKDLATTQIYAKVMDKNKRAAVAAIPSVLHVGEDGITPR